MIGKDFAGRAALVTGAGVGIGRTTAQLLAENGAFVGIHFNTSDASAGEALEAIREQGGDGMLLQADLTDEAAVRRTWRSHSASHASPGRSVVGSCFSSSRACCSSVSSTNHPDLRQTSIMRDWQSSTGPTATAPS